MAKRFQLLKEFGRTTKKPKLDISINKVRDEPIDRFQVNPVFSSAPNNFWDDDDDDVILLATQVAESEAACIPESEITLSLFASPVGTSTQNPVENSLTFLLDGEDDDAVLFAAAKSEYEPEFCAKDRITDTNSTENFRKPSLPKNACVETSQSDARRQVASERQIKFLTETMDLLKNENLKLSKELSDNKVKLENKDGETALLRDELRHMKQQIQALKMEKIFSTEAAKTECKTKIVELCKTVKEKETALQLKSVECSVLKMRQNADETQRMEMSLCKTMFLPGMDDEVEDPNIVSNLQNLSMTTDRHGLMRLRSLSINPSRLKQYIASAPNLCELIFDQTNERGGLKQRSLFQLELEQLQMIVAQLQSSFCNDHSNQKGRVFTEAAVSSVSKVFPEFWSYVHSLEFPKNCRIHPYHDYELQLDIIIEGRSLQQPLELYAQERALTLRRYVATLSVLCRKLPLLAQALLTHQHGEHALLQITNDAIAKLGYSREVCEHFGLIESFATLLHALLTYVTPATPETSQIILVSLLKQLIFTRPSPWIFREITACIWECTRLPYALSQLCVNSPAIAFRSDRVCSLYRFSNESCLLQVYAGLLEIAFPLNTPLLTKHFELMSVICANHLRFVYFCFANPPAFIHNLLPLYNDDDDEAESASDKDAVNISSTAMPNAEFESNSASHTSSLNFTAHNVCAGNQQVTTITCQCYTKLCLSVVTLIFQLLWHWLRAEKSLETTRVAEISKIAVQILHIIFCDNYLTCLFREAEETTKHYLFLICTWWEENALLLHFGDFHMNFLRKLQKSHVMPQQTSKEENCNIERDLCEWHRMTKDVEKPSASRRPTSLQLLETASVLENFYAGLQGYAFNFQ